MSDVDRKKCCVVYTTTQNEDPVHISTGALCLAHQDSSPPQVSIVQEGHKKDHYGAAPVLVGTNYGTSDSVTTTFEVGQQ